MKMQKLRLIPEYENVSKLYLSFENNFFNTRFKYRKAVAVMDDVVLISNDIIDKSREDEIRTILKNLIKQEVLFTPSLPGDCTNDLDTYLLLTILRICLT